MTNRLRIAMIQMLVQKSKEENVRKATSLIKEAVNNGAKLVALPEYFTCVCDPEYMREAKEPIPGPTTKTMGDLAKQLSIHLIAGTIPECTEKDGRLFNSSSVLGPDGQLIVTHKKMHMFDVDLGPHLHITESSVNQPGSKFSVFSIGKFNIGLGVCLDMRYPEISRIYTQRDTGEIDEVKSHINQTKLSRSDLYVTKDLTVE